MLEIAHNFDPAYFLWLWAKYVIGFNDRKHCTNSIRGRYSKSFSKHNPGLVTHPSVLLDEQPWGSFQAVYVCGVAKKGYSTRQNYPHNVHAAILPELGADDEWHFEQWHMRIKNGRFLTIPSSPNDLPERYLNLPTEFTTCRIFRWAACHFDKVGTPWREV